MRRNLMNKLEVREVFKRDIACKSMDSSLLECIADAVGMVIEENNRRILDEFEYIQKGRSAQWKI